MKLSPKNAAAAEMVRALRKLQDALDEQGALTEALKTETDNALYTFLALQPRSVADEVRDG